MGILYKPDVLSLFVCVYHRRGWLFVCRIYEWFEWVFFLEAIRLLRLHLNRRILSLLKYVE